MTTQATRVAAYGIARRADEVLLARASDTSDVPGTWWLPGGGIEFGEDPQDAVVREVLEETGLTARVVGPARVLSDRMHVARRDLDLHSIRLCYPIEVVAGDLVAEVDGSTDLPAWVSIAEARDLPLQPFVRTVLGL